MQPLVSVVLPVYNRQDTIMRALNSVLMQTYRNIEAIVVDDCSTDATVQIVKNCKDSRLNLVCLSSNCGANVARNVGIQHAKGTFVAFQDSDDEWLEDKLDRQVHYMLKTGVHACYCPYALHTEDECNVVPESYKNRDICERDIVQELKRGNIVGTPTLIVKKEIFADIGLFDEEMKRMQDYELVIRLVEKFRIGYVDEPLVNAYRMKESISMKREILAETCIKLLEKHIDFFDLEEFLYGYYRYCDISGDGELKQEEIERVAAVVRNSRGDEAGQECYWAAMRYVQGQYRAVNHIFREWYDFWGNDIQTGEFAIYGAGMYGLRAYDDFKKKNRVPRCFLVTQPSGKKEIEGVPIISLTECTDTEIPVIIAVAWETQGELIKNLLRRGMYRFVIYPFCHCR